MLVSIGKQLGGPAESVLTVIVIKRTLINILHCHLWLTAPQKENSRYNWHILAINSVPDNVLPTATVDVTAANVTQQIRVKNN